MRLERSLGLEVWFEREDIARGRREEKRMGDNLGRVKIRAHILKFPRFACPPIMMQRWIYLSPFVFGHMLSGECSSIFGSVTPPVGFPLSSIISYSTPKGERFL